MTGDRVPLHPRRDIVTGPAVLFRRAGHNEAGIVRDLTRSAYEAWVPLIGREPKPMGADYDRAVRDHRVDLASVAGKVVGLVEMIEQPDHLLVENVAVAPDRQGEGIGRALMHHAEQTAAQLGFNTVRLYTNQRFARNVRFYDALGYALDREEELPHGVAVHMSKAVAPATAGVTTVRL